MRITLFTWLHPCLSKKNCLYWGREGERYQSKGREKAYAQERAVDMDYPGTGPNHTSKIVML